MASLDRVSVLLFNLGGPDSLDSVQPFLFNLFYDPAIIALPNPLRWIIAKAISARRAPVAREIYRQMGGASPILARTQAQAAALSEKLAVVRRETSWQVEIAMRYWHPRADEAADRLRAFAPEHILLLPLYPQYSTTTTASSVLDWHRAADARGLGVPVTLVCCYPDHPALIDAQVELIAAGIEAARAEDGGVALRLLLSAHGLPKKVIARGDPYQWQVERTAAALVAALKGRGALTAEDEAVICYQSRVGPLQWIGPATEDEVKRAGADGRALVVAPIAFVSEHSETLVELDIEYAALARASGVPSYTRVPALDAHPGLIACLADLVTAALGAAGETPRIASGLADAAPCRAGYACCAQAAATGT